MQVFFLFLFFVRFFSIFSLSFCGGVEGWGRSGGFLSGWEASHFSVSIIG